MSETVESGSWPQDLENWIDATSWVTRDLLILLMSSLIGAAVGFAVSKILRGHGFNEIWIAPWSEETGVTWGEGKARAARTTSAGLLVTLSLWGVGIWCVAVLHEWVGFERFLLATGRLIWTLALFVTVAVYISRLLAKSLVDILEFSQIREALDRCFPSGRSGSDRFSKAVIQASGTAVYVIVFVLVFMAAAEILGWRSLEISLSAFWSLVLRIATAGAAFLIGWSGIKWMERQEMVPSGVVEDTGEAPMNLKTASDQENDHEPDKAKLRSFAIVAVTLLAVLLLSGSVAGLSIALALLVAAVFIIVAFQGYLPAFGAGLFLKFKQVREIPIDGKPARIKQRGPLFSKWDCNGETVRMSNKEALDIFLGKQD